MPNFTLGLLHGMVFETNVKSFTGPLLYSDRVCHYDPDKCKNPPLNIAAEVPLIGIAAGVSRTALSVIHTIGHLSAALFTFKKGHLFHAAKGCCEGIRGVIETMPIIGRIFANLYNLDTMQYNLRPSRCWWMIKIYNPEKPDSMDRMENNWRSFPPLFYVKA